MSKKRNKRISPGRRKKVYWRDQGMCRYCGRQCIPGNKDGYSRGDDLLTIDHIMPVRRGGTYDLDNLVVACGMCNRRKSNRTPSEAGMTLLPIPMDIIIVEDADIEAKLAPRLPETYSPEDLETPNPERWSNV